jgi:hypothetical protein
MVGEGTPSYNHKVSQEALVKQSGSPNHRTCPHFLQTLNPVQGFAVAVTPPVWQTNIGEYILSLPVFWRAVVKHYLERGPISWDWTVLETWKQETIESQRAWGHSPTVSGWDTATRGSYRER